MWCIRSRQPGIGRTGTPSVSSTCGSVRGGAGKNGRSPSSGGRSSWLNAIRTRTPRAAAPRIASATRVADRAGQAHVVECEVERPARPREPGHDALGDRLGVWPPSVWVRTSSMAGDGTPAARLSSPTCAVGLMAELIDICPVEELPPGAMRMVEWEDLEIAVVNCAGDLLAIEDRCSHDDGDLVEGDLNEAPARSNARGTGRSSTCAPASP